MNKRRATTAIACLLALSAPGLASSAQSAQESDEPPSNWTTGGTVTKFLAGQAKLDTTAGPGAAPKLKPFTLGAKAEGQAQPLSADAQDAGFNGQSMTPALDKNGRPLTAAINSNSFKLQTEQNMRLLSKYNLELLVDRSQSMRTPDCPDNVSRWEWCGMQAASLALTLVPIVPQGMTIVPFASEFDVFDNASPTNIAYIFDNMRLQSGTRLYEPLAEQADRYFADRTPNKKPLLIVVVTDGVPAPKIEPQLVRQELVAISNRLKNPHEATVIFCQIGGADNQGRAYLQDLDQNLTSYGARYDIVHTISFEDLQQFGLGNALAATIQHYAPAPPVPAPKANSAVLATSKYHAAHSTTVATTSATVAHHLPPTATAHTSPAVKDGGR